MKRHRFFAFKASSTLMVLAALLSGCVVAPTASEIFTKPDAAKGTVIAKAEGNRLAMLSSSWIGLRVKSNTTNKEYFIPNRLGLGPGAPGLFLGNPRHIFVSQLEPDSYSLIGIEGTFTGLLTDWMLNNLAHVKAGDSLGTFKVEAGKLTNLGTLFAFYPSKAEASRKFAVARINTSDAELRGAMQRVAPEALPILQNTKHLGWNESPMDGKALLETARANSYAVGSAFVDEGGSYWVGGQTGQIIKRSPSGQWIQFDTGYLMPVNEARPIGNGLVVAGLEDGIVLIGNEKIGWKNHPLPHPGSVVAVGQLSNGDLVAVTGDKQIQVFTSSCCNDIDWKLAYTAPMEGSWFLGAVITPQAVLAIKVTPGIPPRRTVYRYSVSKNVWTAEDVKGATFMPHVGLDKSTICIGEAYSPDSGESWSLMDQPGFVLACRDSRNIYSKKVAKMGWSYNDFALHWSTNKGKDWTQITDKLPDGAHQIEFLPDTNQLLVRSQTGKIYTSSDHGQSWVLERSVNDTASPLISK